MVREIRRHPSLLEVVEWSIVAKEPIDFDPFFDDL
jgi:hypothetical protein